MDLITVKVVALLLLGGISLILVMNNFNLYP
jgi:hypothetical protein